MMHFYKTLCLLFMCLFMHGNASSQHTNWKKYQKLEGDIDSLYIKTCLLYTSPSPRDRQKSRMPSSA